MYSKFDNSKKKVFSRKILVIGNSSFEWIREKNLFLMRLF